MDSTRSERWWAWQRSHGLLHRPSKHDPVIDGVRALAICWVLALHAYIVHRDLFPEATQQVYNSVGLRWLGQGGLGVDLFFTISGYLIGTILFTEFGETGRIDVRRFYLRRFIRLMPVYAVAMVLARYLFHARNWEHAWANLVYVNNFLRGNDQYMGWCWSLAIEEQFYFIFPWFVVFLMHRRRGRMAMLLVLLALSGIIRLAVLRAHDFVPPYLWLSDPAERAKHLAERALLYDLLYTKPYARYAGLLSGVVGAYTARSHREWLVRVLSRRAAVDAMCLASIGLLLAIVFVPLGLPALLHVPPLARQLYDSYFRAIFSICSMFLILAATYSNAAVASAVRAFLSYKGFYPVAQLSYSIYLIHVLILAWVFPRVANWPGMRVWSALAVAGALGGLLVLAGAALLYLFVERPCMDLRASPSSFGAAPERSGGSTGTRGW